MRSRLTKVVDTLRSSYWFLPGLMASAAVVLSFTTVAIDERYPTVLEDIGIGSGGVDGARGLLETAAGSLITVAGVSFSIAIVLMSLASSQFGPRLLRTFMRDKGNQVVLGVFVSTFLYCLLVLRTIRGEDAGGLFVPHLSVSISVVLTVASLAVFIFFITMPRSSSSSPTSSRRSVVTWRRSSTEPSQPIAGHKRTTRSRRTCPRAEDTRCALTLPGTSSSSTAEVCWILPASATCWYA